MAVGRQGIRQIGAGDGCPADGSHPNGFAGVVECRVRPQERSFQPVCMFLSGILTVPRSGDDTMKSIAKYLRLSFLAGMSVGLTLGPSIAGTIGYADAVKILSSSCGGDIQKYCPKANLGDDGIRNCLQEHQTKVSQQCKADYARVFDLISARFAAQESAPRICSNEIENLCRGVRRSSGYTLQCLLTKRDLGKKCAAVLVDAGWAN